MRPGATRFTTAWRVLSAVSGGTTRVTRDRLRGARPASWSGAVTRETLVRLGPVPTKFGQILGSRVDLVGERWRTELAPLHDRVPFDDVPAPDLDAHGLDAAARRSLVISGRTLGSGSVAVVHAGMVGDLPVAVKMRRPTVPTSMAGDLAVLVGIGALVARLPALRVLPVREVVCQVAEIVGAQVDLLQEAEHLVRLGEVARGWGVEIPAPLPSHTTESLLTTPLLEGLDTGTWSRLDAEACSVRIEATMNFVYDALFNHGIVHADLHPGNLYATSAGVVVLDGGMVFTLTEHARRSFLAFFLSFATGDGFSCGEIVWALSVRPPCAETRRAEFMEAMSGLIRRHHGREAADFSLITFSRELFALQRRFELRSSPEFALPVLALLVVEGTVREHTPHLDFQALAVPHLLRATFALAPDEQYGDGIWATSS